jgi:hypothetical protein
MTFLNPLVLFGLIAASVPILLHLLNLRKLRVVEFSTLSFLKELQQTKIRRLKLRQILLLIIRTLLVVAIVFAFARPALRGTMLGSIGSHAHSSVVFILDDSFSMSTSDEHGERFKQAKEAMIKLAGMLKDGDESFFIKLSDLPKASIEMPNHDPAALLTVINEAKISPVRRTMDDALKVAAKLLSRSSNANKEIYVVSDMQQTLFPVAVSGTADQAQLFPEGTQLFSVSIGTKTIANTAVDSLEITTKIFEQGKPVSLFCSIRNFGPSPVNNSVVSVFLDGVRAAQQNISLPAWGASPVAFSITPKKSGFIAGYVELENDAVAEDNRRYFAFFVPEHISVAVVSNKQQDLQFLLLALKSGQMDERSSLVTVQETTPDKFPLLSLNGVDVLISVTLSGFSSADEDRIASFVRGGGGLILFPQSDFTFSPSSSRLLQVLNLSAIRGITGGSNVPTGLFFQNIDSDHPIFSSMFQNNTNNRISNNQIESPSFFKNADYITGKKALSIITLSNKSSFLSEQEEGKGTILFFTVAPVLSWSDFPLKGIFAPLLYRSTLYSSASEFRMEKYIAGDEATISLSKKGTKVTFVGNDRAITLTSPDGVEEIVQLLPYSSENSKLSLKATNLRQTGIYTASSNKTAVTMFDVNTDPSESDLRMNGGNERSDFWSRNGLPASSVHNISPSEQIQNVILQSRFGIELWKYCIAAALLLALLEMLIARDGRKSQQSPE